MKKIAVLTIGLLLAAGPAFAEASVDQTSEYNGVANSLGESYANGANNGASNVTIDSASGIVHQNINTGNASNVGAATDVVVTGGVSSDGTTVLIGGSDDKNKTLSLASLSQVSSGNQIGMANGTFSNSNSSNSGLANVGICNTSGVVSQQINVGNASNVGSAVGITVH